MRIGQPNGDRPVPGSSGDSGRPRAAEMRARTELANQPSLADPRFAGYQDDFAAAIAYLPPGRLHGRYLGLSADEHSVALAQSGRQRDRLLADRFPVELAYVDGPRQA